MKTPSVLAERAEVVLVIPLHQLFPHGCVWRLPLKCLTPSVLVQRVLVQGVHRLTAKLHYCRMSLGWKVDKSLLRIAVGQTIGMWVLCEAVFDALLQVLCELVRLVPLLSL